MKLDSELFTTQAHCVATNYFAKGYCFAHLDADGEKVGTLILIHGWGVRSAAMNFLARYFVRNGFAVYNYDYPTSKHGIERHGELFLEKFRSLRKQLADREKIFILTHSMGALLLRTALAQMTPEECGWISRIVMLAPPNQGSHWGELAQRLGLRRLAPALTDMGTTPKAFVNTIPPPLKSPPIGIIAGAHDWKVAPKQVLLPDIPHHLLQLPYGHAKLRHTSIVCQNALYFLLNGNFPNRQPS